MTTTIANKNLEQQLRRALNKHGYSLHKSCMPFGSNNLGGYMIIWDKYNACVAGPNFNFDLDDVAKWFNEMCQE